MVDSLDAGMSSAHFQGILFWEEAGASLGLSVVWSSEEVETEHTEQEILLRMVEMDSRWPWVLPQLKLRCLFFPCPRTYLFPWSIVVFSFQCACLSVAVPSCLSFPSGGSDLPSCLLQRVLWSYSTALFDQQTRRADILQAVLSLRCGCLPPHRRKVAVTWRWCVSIGSTARKLGWLWSGRWNKR